MATGSISGDRQYVRIQRLTYDAIDEIKLNISPDIRSVISTIKPDFSIDLPNDAVRVYKVGALCKDGSIIVFGEEKTYKEEAIPCDCPGCGGTVVTGQSSSSSTSTTAPYCSNMIFHNYLFSTGYYGELFGARMDRFSAGKWTQNDTTISFTSGTLIAAGLKVVVEYETSFNKKSLRMIDRELAPILRNKVLHEFYLPVKQGLADKYFLKFVDAMENRNIRKTAMNHDEWLAMFTNYSNAPQ